MSIDIDSEDLIWLDSLLLDSRRSHENLLAIADADTPASSSNPPSLKKLAAEFTDKLLSFKILIRHDDKGLQRM